MENIINYVIQRLMIHNFDDLYRRWEDALDLFFYFNKMTGCGIPTMDYLRRYLHG